MKPSDKGKEMPAAKKKKPRKTKVSAPERPSLFHEDGSYTVWATGISWEAHEALASIMERHVAYGWDAFELMQLMMRTVCDLETIMVCNRKKSTKKRGKSKK